MAVRHLLSLHAVSLAFGGDPVLDGVSLNIDSGMRACVTGRNGEGKSTLLKVIAGRLEPDAGEIIRAPGLKVAFLEQEVPHDRPGTVRDIAGNPKAVSQMGLDPDVEFNTLSGGLRRRVLLARTLADNPDLVLLDEPTNHLDTDSIEWLESFVRRPSECAFLFVTHDRAFLKSTANFVYDLDRGRLAGWNCDYRTFLARKADLIADEAALWEKKAKRLAQEEAWIRQGVKARRTRNQGRVEALRQLRLEFANRRMAAGSSNIRIGNADASGNRVIKIENLTFSYPGGEPIIRDFTADVIKGERIGIVGANGSGKTTLLNLLAGRLAPTSGTVTPGTRIEMAFFDQLRETLDPEATVAEAVNKDRDTVTIGGVTKHIYAYLADFLFTPERARTPVKALSGGEKARLLLAKLFLRPSNLLVMDEPTNDLDVETLELLEEQLLAYKGTLLVVSHDREFLDHAVTSCFVLPGDGTVRVSAGGYEEAARLLKTIRAENAPKTGKEKEQKAANKDSSGDMERKGKLSYREKRELEELPGRIEKLEAEMLEIEQALADPTIYARDNVRALELTARLPQAREELDAAETRWLELSDRA